MDRENDHRALARELADLIEGEVRFDAGSRALYSTDASNYRQVPIGVVVPKSREDVVRTVEACRLHGVPVLPRGGGTSLAGQCCNVAVVLDFSKYLTRLLEVDPGRRRARVEPGLILDHLRQATEPHHLTFGPDPATHSCCTLGGMLGNNACGVHSIMAGKTVDNVATLEVLTYDGERIRVGPTSDEDLARTIAEEGRRSEIYRRLKGLVDRHADRIRAEFPKIPRRVSGYNLDQLLPENGFHVARALVGSEGTCVTILEAEIDLVEWPRARSLLVLGYEDIYAAAQHVPEILEFGPIGLEGIDHKVGRVMRARGMRSPDTELLPPGGGWLLVEFGGETRATAEEKAKELAVRLQNKRPAPSMRLYDDPVDEKMVWEVREAAVGATARIPGERDTWAGWEDSAVDPQRLADYLQDLRVLFDRYDYDVAIYGHFGDGCVHCRIPFDLRTHEGIDAYKAFVEEAADLVVSYGGSLSGEHGDGQSRGPLLDRMYSPEIMTAFREFKSIWDPAGRMNPGKVVDSFPLDSNLRLGADYAPPRIETLFRWPEDDGEFPRAILRCVGLGNCRRTEGGTMCPSYMVTHEEMHSTRGRARLLFEMLHGEELGGWRDDHVREALDLCLACKGCKSDCPVNVDMATYKAEFLSHYYARRIRPRSAYTMGLVAWWARLASMAPGPVNAAAATPFLGAIVKRLAGVAPERELPPLAARTFRACYRRRPAHGAGDRGEVLLWPDTFNNYFHPEIALAAVDVLEAAGYRVTLPERVLCCGRPLYDYGMLTLARRWLERILETLVPSIRAGVPVIGLEPSCVAVFRDELHGLFPDDERAQRLRGQTFTLAEFLIERADWTPPSLEREAIVHGHCHHKAIMGLDADKVLFDRLGLDWRVLDSGCCGMAGAFGFERDHFDVSTACGERVLIPAVRDAGYETLIVADGFSCREQIRQMAGRRAHHTAEVIRMALAGQAASVSDRSKEKR